jgi:anti-sigma factor RsiW
MTDHSLDTVVAGVPCREVLADLSDFLDGALSDERVAQLQAHLGGCDNCSRFGGRVAQTLGALRSTVVARPANVALGDRIMAAVRGAD